MVNWKNMAEDGVKQVLVEGIAMSFKDLKTEVMKILEHKFNGSEKEFEEVADKVILAVMEYIGIPGIKARRPTKSS